MGDLDKCTKVILLLTFHIPSSQVILLALPGTNVENIQSEVARLCALLPRSSTAEKAIANSCILQCQSKAEAINISNAYAPEHLIINTADAETWVDEVASAGSIFVGRWTPESMGDYASGTNHVLPTYGYAAMYSGVSLDAFQKKITVQTVTEEGLKVLGPHVAKMAEVEGLDAHRMAVTLRLESLQGGK